MKRIRLIAQKFAYLIFAGLAISMIQAALIVPPTSISDSLQTASAEYQRILQQAAETSSHLVTTPKFSAIDPLQAKPNQEPFLKQHPEVANLLAVKAFLWGAIYYAEGTYTNFTDVSPYRLILGEESFESYADHPRRIVTVNPGTYREVSSDASGACQFTSETWDKLHEHYPHVWYENFPAFHPKNQDIGCLLLFAEVGGYKELTKGVTVNDFGEIQMNVDRFMAAVAISCPIWASFPCENGVGAYDKPEYGNQPAKLIEELWRSYRIALEAEQSLLLLRTET